MKRVLVVDDAEFMKIALKAISFIVKPFKEEVVINQLIDVAGKAG